MASINLIANQRGFRCIGSTLQTDGVIAGNTIVVNGKSHVIAVLHDEESGDFIHPVSVDAAGTNQPFAVLPT